MEAPPGAAVPQPPFAAPRLWCVLNLQVGMGAVEDGSATVPFNLSWTAWDVSSRAVCVLPMPLLQLACLTPEEQAVHATNVGAGVYVAGAALVQLAAGSAVAPGSML